MSKLVPLARLQFEVPPVPAKDIGQPGYFAWIDLHNLLVDENYQRPIEASGKKNIRRIVEEFHWTKFGPLIVSPRHGGVFAIIDGQHHAVAALIHGSIPKAPCWVLTCTPEEEARAFSTINGIVTRVHPQYLFRARIASGDPGAVAADEAARAAGARIMPYPQQAHQLKVGETLAGKTIEAVLGKYGREAVVTAMELVTRTGDGNPGWLKADLIEGFCDALFKHPKWLANKDGMRAAVAAKGVPELHADAMASYGRGGSTIRIQVSAHLSALLSMKLGDGGKDAGPVKTLQMQSREQAKRDHWLSQRTRPPAPPAPSPVTAPKPPEQKKHYPAVVPRPALRMPVSQLDGQRAGVDLDHDGKFKITTYLIRKGHMASIDRQGYRIDGQHMDIHEALDLVNDHRAKAELPPLTAKEVV